VRFAITDEQRAFASALDSMLSDTDVPSAVRAWANGDHAPGLALWRRLAGVGLQALMIAEEHGGGGAGSVDMVVALECLGYHAVPGPVIESTVLVPALLAAGDDPCRLLPKLAEGAVLASVAAPPLAPYALDADVVDQVFLLDESGTLSAAEVGARRHSVDASRRLFTVSASERLAKLPAARASSAVDAAVLGCAAQLLGAGERMLESAVTYAKTRRQFGRVIGEYQAVKHGLADVKVALDFARPLVYGAALSFDSRSADALRDVAAAKVAVSVAAQRAARTALQVHGAIGYTAEYDLGLWITKVRALAGAWGGPSAQRAKVLAQLV